MTAIQTQYSLPDRDSSQLPSTLPEEKKHILVVDDELSNRLILRNILQQEYEVHECENGKVAMGFLQSCIPNIILLDVMMPLMNGYEFCRAIKADPETVDIPILFITLLADTQQVVKAFDLGAADYLTKPFYGEEVLARIRRQLLIEEKTEFLEQKSGNLEQLVSKETRELMRAERHIAYGRLVQSIVHNMKNPSVSLTRGVKHTRNAQLSLTECYESGADLNSDLMETHLRCLDRSLTLVENASERLSGVVASLLARVMDNKDTSSQIIDVNTVIRDKISFLEANPFFANQVKKKLLLCEDALPVVAVTSELAQLFDNLLSNSINALQQQNRGTEMISIKTRMIGSRVEIKISDNGCGISREDQEHIFTPFFTTKDSTENDKEPLRDLSGTGLGLFLCHNTVQSLRGKIGVRSKLGKGTTFYITLPLAIQEEPKNEQ